VRTTQNYKTIQTEFWNSSARGRWRSRKFRKSIYFDPEVVGMLQNIALSRPKCDQLKFFSNNVTWAKARPQINSARKSTSFSHFVGQRHTLEPEKLQIAILIKLRTYILGKWKFSFYFAKLWSHFRFFNFGVPYWITMAAGSVSAEKGCIPLLTTKYEPDVVKTDRDSYVGKW